jgi:broad specificity phosphatase PhoE
LVAFSHNWEIREEIKERSFGEWEGKSWEVLEREFPEGVKKWKETPFLFTPPGRESDQKVLQRVAPFWEDLLHRPEEKLLVVTHGGVMLYICLPLGSRLCLLPSCFLFDPGVLVKIRGDHSFWPGRSDIKY